MLGLYRLQRIN